MRRLCVILVSPFSASPPLYLFLPVLVVVFVVVVVAVALTRGHAGDMCLGDESGTRRTCNFSFPFWISFFFFRFLIFPSSRCLCVFYPPTRCCCRRRCHNADLKHLFCIFVMCVSSRRSLLCCGFAATLDYFYANAFLAFRSFEFLVFEPDANFVIFRELSTFLSRGFQGVEFLLFFGFCNLLGI